MALTKVGSHPSHGGQVVFNATASFTLDPSDSGKIFILKDAAITVTLPTLSTNIAGFQVRLISGDGSNHVIAGGASLIYGQIGDFAGSNFERIAAASGYTLSNGEIGDWFELISDGTNWYISGLTDNGA
jgi:hypothetical protein